MSKAIAMLLAAGRGQRMRHLTEQTPKPLISVGGRPLIEWQLERLASAGVERVVINVAYLGEQIVAALGDGSNYGVEIVYSHEPYGLETGGGIAHASTMLGDSPFVVCNSDIIFRTDYDLHRMGFANPQSVARLVLIENPSFKERGDFDVNQGRLALGDRYTFSGLSLISPKLIQMFAPEQEKFGLAPLLRAAAEMGLVEAEVRTDPWFDVGTPERLLEAEQFLTAN